MTATASTDTGSGESTSANSTDTNAGPRHYRFTDSSVHRDPVGAIFQGLLYASLKRTHPDDTVTVTMTSKPRWWRSWISITTTVVGQWGTCINVCKDGIDVFHKDTITLPCGCTITFVTHCDLEYRLTFVDTQYCN